MVEHSIESLSSAPMIPALAGSNARSSSRSARSSTAIGGRNVADHHFASAWAEFERLRQLVPERADFHLANWGRWRKHDVVTVGYADHVPGLDKGIGRCVAEDASDHDYEAHDAHSAEVCDAIIDELPQMYRLRSATSMRPRCGSSAAPRYWSRRWSMARRCSGMRRRSAISFRFNWA